MINLIHRISLMIKDGESEDINFYLKVAKDNGYFGHRIMIQGKRLEEH